jgi:hypothetical protein
LPVRRCELRRWASERAEVLLRSFRRSLAGFVWQRLGSRSMRAKAARSRELCWPAITGVVDSLLLVGDRRRSRFAEVLLRAW